MSEKRHPGPTPRFPIEQLLEMRESGMSNNAIASALGLNRRSVDKRFKAHERRLMGRKNGDGAIPNDAIPGIGRDIARVTTQLDKHGEPKGYTVHEKPESDEHQHAHPLDKLKRVSTYYGADGNIQGQWQITVADEAQQKEAFDQIIEGLKEELEPYEPQQQLSKAFYSKLHNNYVLSDAHIGAMAWKPETGDDWDLKIAEEMLVKCMEAMIQQSPRTEKCTLSLLGDWTHYDMLEAVTTLSRNVIDGDGRQPKMNKVAIRVARRVLSIALANHQHVTVLVAEGNHDLVAAPWLREVLMVAYENEPRVTFIDDPRPYYAFLIGDILHCWHHGHLKGINKPEQLVAIFADEYRELWGKAKKVYVNSGHFHNITVKEVRGAILIQHPTLSGRTSYESRNGWGSVRQAIASTYHERYGKTGQVNVSPEMLEDL